jgi:predicted nucleic acid-binding protein
VRGLRAKNARNKLHRLRNLLDPVQWDDLTRHDWDTAADLWVQQRKQGLPIADADLLIAAFTLNRDAVLVTDNEKDFANLGLTIENWRA